MKTINAPVVDFRDVTKPTDEGAPQYTWQELHQATTGIQNPVERVVTLGPHDIKRLLDRCKVPPRYFEDAEWLASMRFELRNDVAIGLAKIIAAREGRSTQTAEELSKASGVALSPLQQKLYDALKELGREPTIYRVCQKAGLKVMPAHDLERYKDPSRALEMPEHFVSNEDVIAAFNELIKNGYVMRGVRDPQWGVSLTQRSPLLSPLTTMGAGVVEQGKWSDAQHDPKADIIAAAEAAKKVGYIGGHSVGKTAAMCEAIRAAGMGATQAASQFGNAIVGFDPASETEPERTVIQEVELVDDQSVEICGAKLARARGGRDTCCRPVATVGGRCRYHGGRNEPRILRELSHGHVVVESTEDEGE